MSRTARVHRRRMTTAATAMSHAPPLLIVGCMTGTSLDGLDVALVETRGSGAGMAARLHRHLSRPLGDLGAELRRLAEGSPAPPLTYLRAARRLGELHAETIAALLNETRGQSPLNRPLDLVVAHGQTIHHAPGDAACALSWQLLDPWPIVHRLGVPVCYDLRQADLVAGGQGAPLTPLADWVMYRDAARHRVVVNLGGIVNVTDLPGGGAPGDVRGCDLGPCNLLIDGMVRALHPELAYDADGALARRGQADRRVHDAVREHPFFSQAQRSTGREDFTPAWIAALVARFRDALGPADLVASAVDAVAQLIADHVAAGEPAQIILAGGGARNDALVDRIATLVAPQHEVMLSDALHIPCEAREAAGFAVLGALARDGYAVSLPRATGARATARAGAWVYPDAKEL